MDSPQLTRDLVAIPSHDDERAAGEYVARWLTDHTDAVVHHDDHGNVFARRGTGEQSLALVGHHDVVPPDESQLDGETYVLDEHDGRLYGRGTADMKGSLAAAMCAFRDADPTGELVFASFAGEEQGGVGCRAAIEGVPEWPAEAGATFEDGGFAPDFAVVGEGSTGYTAPGVTDVAIAHKGRRGSTVTATGSAAHASEPDAGVNAIYRASDAVDVLRDLSFPETEVLGHSLSGSIAATEIDGGSAWNVIPERCTVTVDERTVPGERADIDRVEAIEGVDWNVDQDLPPMACEDDAFAEAVLSAARDVQDGDPGQVVKPHATDAGWLSTRAGTQCVICGAAQPGEAHTAEESVSLSVVERCKRLYERVADGWP